MRRVRDLPLFWKLLLPFLALIVIFGSLGAYFIVRDLSVSAQEALDRDLARRSFEARSMAHDRELYLVESANFATNIQGMGDAIARRDRRAVETLLGSVLALKTDVTLLVATDAAGVAIAELRRVSSKSQTEARHGGRWNTHEFVKTALGDVGGARRAGFVNEADQHLLAIAAPICPNPARCDDGARGVAIVGLSIDRLTAEAAGNSGLGDRSRAGAAIYGADGRLLARSGLASDTTAPAAPGDGRLVRRLGRSGDLEVATLYGPLEVQGERVGTLAATVPADTVNASVRSTAQRLGLITLLVMLGVIGIGALLSRSILAQLRPLVATNRALGHGDLSARAPVVSNDELGEVARGVNQMADQLQALYETLELRVAQRTEEVHRLLKERTEFFAAVSHDLRTPLAVIRSQTMMMLNPKFADQPPEEVAKTILASSEQLLSLINDLLELSKAEAGRLDVDLDEVRLKDVVKDLRRTIEGLAQAGALKVSINVARDVPTVSADARRLREIVLNLVDNAVKYTPPGGKVELSAAAEDGEVVVRVRDHGIGIPEEARDRIFEPFYRVKGNDPQRGQASTGLGLALTKRFVEAQGGTIYFESAPGGGTTFAFTLKPFAENKLAASNGSASR
ncbi:MAG TPA: HAMP domain-containing sensor histidine kinase [Acidimicrobiales bacterium]|nr:HAMP domain-containing sensor histidine kinase [Acidimicrobiales bacterium]